MPNIDFKDKSYNHAESKKNVSSQLKTETQISN